MIYTKKKLSNIKTTNLLSDQAPLIEVTFHILQKRMIVNQKMKETTDINATKADAK